MGDVISKKTRSELAEHLSGMVLREIERECDAVNIERDQTYDPSARGSDEPSLGSTFTHWISRRTRTLANSSRSARQTFVPSRWNLTRTTCKS